MDAASVLAVFAGEERPFRLDFGEWALLQAKHDVGPYVLRQLFAGMHVTPEQQKDVVKFGLIGGGMDEKDALKLVDATIKAGTLLTYVTLGHDIISAFIGPDDDVEGKPKKN